MKTITLSYCSYLILVAGCISSCAPVLYTSVGQNVPLFKEKGEVAMSVGAANTENSSNDYLYDYSSADGVSLQAAVAIKDNFALMSSFYSLKNMNSSSSSDGWHGKGSYFELGAGFFKFNPRSKLIGEIFFGTGFGSVRNSGTSDNVYVNAKYFKPFVQPSVGFASKIVELAITPRIGLVSYTSHESNSTGVIFDEYFKDKKTSLVIEPGATLRVGYKNVKLQYQVTYTSFNYSTSYGDETFDPVNPLFQSIGVFILIGKRWMSKKEASAP